MRTTLALMVITGIAGVPCAAGPPPARLPFEQPVRHDGQRVVRVRVETPAERELAEALSAEAWDCGGPRGGWGRYRVLPEGMDALEASGLEFVVEIADLQARADAERAEIDALGLGERALGAADLAWFNAYKTYAEYSAYTDALVSSHPGVVSRLALGNSLQGNPIWALRIASPGSATDKPAVFLFALQHAREWVTGMAVMYLAQRLAEGLESDERIGAALATHQFYIVPVMNPDGYLYTWSNNRFWRKNRRPNAGGTVGVDLNRNWSEGWGLDSGSSASPGSATYRGTAAFSEPETRALRDFVSARPWIRAQVDVHSYTQLILSPWGYTGATIAHAPLYDNLNATFEAGMEGPYGFDYLSGPTFTTIYPASGVSADWAAARGMLGWGIECRDLGQTGFELPAAQIVPQGQELLSGILNLAEALDDALRVFAIDAAAAVTAGAAATRTVFAYDSLSTLVATSPRQMARLGRLGEGEATALAPLAPNRYQATYPAAPCGATLYVRFEADAADGRTVRDPDVPANGWYTVPLRRADGTPCTVCPTDFGQDGIIDPDDLGDYITLYFQADAQTEYNHDGTLNPDDLGDYITDYFSFACTPG